MIHIIGTCIHITWLFMHYIYARPNVRWIFWIARSVIVRLASNSINWNPMYYALHDWRGLLGWFMLFIIIWQNASVSGHHFIVAGKLEFLVSLKLYLYAYSAWGYNDKESIYIMIMHIFTGRISYIQSAPSWCSGRKCKTYITTTNIGYYQGNIYNVSMVLWIRSFRYLHEQLDWG